MWHWLPIPYFDDILVSIHTPTQGVTRRFEWEVCGTGCFNPHTHAGCDHLISDKILAIRVSIHTPTQGVTHGVFSQYARYRFQSTHPRRVWHRVSYAKILIILVSIHTPTQGVTGGTVYVWVQSRVSIHTPTQGVTFPFTTYKTCLLFQSTHPRRVWRSYI